MRTAVASLESLSPYSPSRRIMTPREPKEPWDEWEKRVWKERIHVTPEGRPFIPPMAFKRSLELAGKFLRMRIEGKGTSEYGKHFVAGVLVPEGLLLPGTVDDVEYEDLPLSSRGRRGHMDVIKREPLFREWAGEVTYYILDDIIGHEVFETHLREAGNFIGIGRFRPENGGFYGRYKVNEVAWSE